MGISGLAKPGESHGEGHGSVVVAGAGGIDGIGRWLVRIRFPTSALYLLSETVALPPYRTADLVRALATGAGRPRAPIWSLPFAIPGHSALAFRLRGRYPIDRPGPRRINMYLVSAS